MPMADAVAMPRVSGLPGRTVSLSTTSLLCAAAVFAGAAAAAAGLAHGQVRPVPVLTTAGASTSAASFALTNFAGGRCLGIAADARDRYVLLQKCAAGSGSAGQHWHWGRESPDGRGFHQLITDSGNCLGLADDRTSPGTSVVVRRCAGPGDAGQFWQSATSFRVCTKRSMRYNLLISLRAVESPREAALVIGADAAGTTGGPIVLRQWAGQCNDEYWAQQAR
jgi:hypothetical protein